MSKQYLSVYYLHHSSLLSLVSNCDKVWRSGMNDMCGFLKNIVHR